MFRMILIAMAVLGSAVGATTAQGRQATATVCCTNTKCSAGGCWQHHGKHCVYESSSVCVTHNCLSSDQCSPM